ncbi:MAG: KUP/HAK/KT family potassium transporter [Alphaproteobacteria bacterium]|nr:KUP/HAK/KT family potassium transporter [Alphaproteobacteria bacterium]
MTTTHHPKQEKTMTLFVGALGIVFGDIGTSPLYALKSCFTISDLPVNEGNVLGIISLFIWALFLVVWLKYALLVMRVDNHGEGGILALTTLCHKLKLFHKNTYLIALSIIGMGLFFGDGIITPAISVLSAVEGLELITQSFSPYVVPLAIGILTLLFLIQKHGSGYIGHFFGPIMIIWFLFLAITGLIHIIQMPSMLKVFNPYYALYFLSHHGLAGIMTLGGVVLVVTGGEALYADMGHFGRRSIQLSWGTIVFPALILNYLGQGAVLLHDPITLSNPFYALVPAWALYPSVILATVASIIASQSIISGIFTITSQAMLLGYLPRMQVIHTSAKQIGQVYIGSINAILFVLTVGAVLMFGSSDNLAHAYGLSVSGVMLLTSVLITLIAYKEWQWALWRLSLIFLPLIMLDTLFVITNMMKLLEGAWYAILVTGVIYYIVHVWMKGNKALEAQKVAPHTTLTTFLKNHEKEYKQRIPGIAIFLSRQSNKVPNSLTIHLHHNKFLHEKTIFLCFTIKDSPVVQPKERFETTKIDRHSYTVEAKFGFKESPNLNRVIHYLKEEKIITDCEGVSVFLSKGVPVATNARTLEGFSEKLYIFLVSISQNASDFYKIPHHKVIELGVRYKI